MVSLGLGSEQIFCSSVKGHTIPPGVEFTHFMHYELTTRAAVVRLIGPAYVEHIWCVCELGATLGLGLQRIPPAPGAITTRDFEVVMSICKGDI